MKEHKYFVGKLSRNMDKSGTRNCHAYITWSFEDGKFSMCGEVWNHIKTDIYMGGQCVDTIADLFPHDKKLQRMRAIWKDWHLNDMKSGNVAQTAFLRANPPTDRYSYDQSLGALTRAGLSPDPETGYVYGTAWLAHEIPADIAAEINSWSAQK
jgi:hypothetical protein